VINCGALETASCLFGAGGASELGFGLSEAAKAAVASDRPRRPQKHAGARMRQPPAPRNADFADVAGEWWALEGLNL
jgi:hypothetical protein